MRVYNHSVFPRKIHLHSIIWLKCPLPKFKNYHFFSKKASNFNQIGTNSSYSTDILENDHDNEEPIEIRIEKKGYWKEISKKMQHRFDNNNILISRYTRTTVGRIIFNLIIQDCVK